MTEGPQPTSLQRLVDAAPRTLAQELMPKIQQAASWGKSDVRFTLTEERWVESVAAKALAILTEDGQIEGRLVPEERSILLRW